MGKNLLIVDDQMGVRRLLYEAFQEENYQIELAGSGFEALDKIGLQRPDLVLMDMKMPGMNGLEVLRELKNREIALKFILMTAYGELEIVTEAMSLGIAQYITKPFDINEVRQIVKENLSD